MTPGAEVGFVCLCSLGCDKTCYSGEEKSRQSVIATDPRPQLLGESLFLTVLHCKHTTEATPLLVQRAKPQEFPLCFLLSLSLSRSTPPPPPFYSSLSPSFPPSQIDQLETLARRRLNQQESLFLSCRKFLPRLSSAPLFFCRPSLARSNPFHPAEVAFGGGPKCWRECEEPLALESKAEGNDGICWNSCC